MSKSNHSVIAHEVTYIVSEISRLSEEEVKSTYGIELLEKGKVFDPTYDKEFETIGEWATFNVEQDEVETEEQFHGKYYGED